MLLPLSKCFFSYCLAAPLMAGCDILENKVDAGCSRVAARARLDNQLLIFRFRKITAAPFV